MRRCTVPAIRRQVNPARLLGHRDDVAQPGQFHTGHVP
jgi:hypothetical protein